jgi:ankyrin repeat protein
VTAIDLLQDAIAEEDASRAARAIAQGADVNAFCDDETMLSAAAQTGNVELVKLLLAAGADPNRKNADGTTALTWSPDAAMSEALLGGGASARYELGGPPDARRHGVDAKVEFSSLHNAADDGDLARLELLIVHGDAACLLRTFTTGVAWTPLHYAAHDGHCAAAQLLIDAGADPNCVDDDLGYSAISLAAERDDLAMVELLLANGADPALETGTGRSALSIARQHVGNPALLECIEKTRKAR